MKSFPLRIILMAVLLPPVLYVVTLHSLEISLHKRLRAQIEEVYVGDTEALFKGSLGLRESITRNVDDFLDSCAPVSLFGVRANILITTRGGELLYPEPYSVSGDGASMEASVVAAENYRRLDEGLLLSVEVKLGHGALLSNLILGFYVLLSFVVLLLRYRSWSRLSWMDEKEKNEKIGRLLVQEGEYRKSLADLSRMREKLAVELKSLKSRHEAELEKASHNEDEMINDIVALEERLDSNLALQNKQRDEIDALSEKLKRYEKRGTGRHRHGALDLTEKRFKTLYKNVELDKRALEGFLMLTEELKIKGEEVIHQLNFDPSVVSIKRKVFGKKNRETVFEVIFAYKGRLYFGKTREGKIVVRAVGTKNTQVKDLEYLDNL